MSDAPKHIIVPVFFNYRGTVLFRDKPVTVKVSPTALQSVMSLFSSKHAPKEKVIFTEHFYYGFEFNPRQVKSTKLLLGSIFDFFHSRGITYNYTSIAQDTAFEIWAHDRRYHVFPIMADIRNPHLCEFGYFDPVSGKAIIDDNELRSQKDQKSVTLSQRIVRDQFREGKIMPDMVRIVTLTPKEGAEG